MSDSDPTQTPPPDAEVEAALAHLESFTVPRVPTRMTASIATLRTHIAALTAQNAALVAERDALLKSIEHLSSDVIPDRAFVPGGPCFVCGDPLTGFATCDGNPGHTTGLTWAAFRRVHAAREELADKRDARIVELVAERDALRGELEAAEQHLIIRDAAATRAGREALEWVLTLEDDPSAMNKIEAEIARLKAQGEAPSDE